MKLTFGFSKKAEPKRHVAALSTKKADDREEIKGMDEDGKLVLEKPKEGQGPPIIKCKNPIEGTRAKPINSAKKTDGGSSTKVLDKPLEDLPGGIVTQGIAKLSDEDAEAMRELLKDAAREDGDEAPAVAMVPILMKEGSKRIRNGEAAAVEATKEMYENVAVETFGEAMLRGMGFDPSVHKTKPIFRDKLRDNLLGLGAAALLPGEKLKIQGKKDKGAKKLPGIASARPDAATAKKSSIAGDSLEAPDSAEPAVSSEGATPASSEPTPKRQRTDDTEAVDVEALPDMWASRGLVVRFIGKDASLKDFFGAEAVILEVDEVQRLCRIKARPKGSDKSQQLKGLRLEDIETRVSRDCTQVRIVRGPQKGVVAKLTKRDTARGVAVLQIEGADTEMSLDDVCQFMG